MKLVKLGILGTSDIAFRRFLPALQNSKEFEFVGIASRELSRTNKFTQSFGGIGYSNYNDLIACNDIDAVYIPLPPSLHYEWAIKALKSGKHVFLEKPFTPSMSETKEVINLAKSLKLAVHENYMFQYHDQLKNIKQLIASGSLGDIRQFRASFGFPLRGQNDFRYNKKLGGGALLDCGGYTLKLASLFLGDSTMVCTSSQNFIDSYEVDMFGSATLKNDKGHIFQVSYGMDNSYKCELEIWGSKGSLTASRIFTAGQDFNPVLILKTQEKETLINLERDDQFLKSIHEFHSFIKHEERREKAYNEILKQATLIDIVQRGDRF
jgi:dTDP-3,4-didehydro-2,6-dideoxy-alpha-D-glucose 3-reductase